LNKNPKIAKLFLFLAPFTWLTSVHAQTAAPPVATGNIEAGAFVGESYGLDKLRPMFGGDVAYGLSRAFYPFVEASYLPGLERELGNGVNYRYKVNMTDVHGGLHVRFPIGGSKVVPYAAAGLGVVRSSSFTISASALGGAFSLGSETIPASTNFAVNFGGGIRFFITERIGIRVEFKAFVPTGSAAGVSNDVFYRLAIGPVFQLK
jgi:hypothetical protein